MNSKNLWRAYWLLVTTFPGHVFDSIVRFVVGFCFICVSFLSIVLSPFIILLFSFMHVVLRLRTKKDDDDRKEIRLPRENQ